jgi:hypothetical protein
MVFKRYPNIDVKVCEIFRGPFYFFLNKKRKNRKKIIDAFVEIFVYEDIFYIWDGEGGAGRTFPFF